MTRIQESMMKDIIAAATDKNNGDDSDDSDEEEVLGHEFKQQIYGENADAVDSTIGNFAALITCTANNKTEWPTLLTAAFADLSMKQQDKGATTHAQKFKGLNSRWFGTTKRKGTDDKALSNLVRRGTIVTIEGHGFTSFCVLAIFSKNYNKWFMCDDTPAWRRDDKKHATFRLSIRQVTYDVALNVYKFVSIAPPNTVNTVVYQLIHLCQLTSIIQS